MDFFGTIIGGITKLAEQAYPALMAINKIREIATQARSIELAQKQDTDNYNFGLKRMEFDANMEMMRQTVRAKERQEDKEFSLKLKEIAAETLLKEEKMRQAFNTLEAEKQQEFTQSIEKFKAEIQIALQADSIAFQRWKTATDRLFSLEITLLNAQINRQRDKQNRDDSKRDRNNPFFSIADDLRQTFENLPEIPLIVFFSPPVLTYDPAPNTSANQFPMIEVIVSSALRDMFKQYTLSSRPIKFMAGEWVIKNRRAESAVHQIFSELHTIPVIVLETEVEESFFNINIGFWSNDFDDARFETVVRKFRWQDAISEISQNILKKWQNEGRQIQSDYDRNEFSRRSKETFINYMEILHCIHVGMVIDEYFLIYAANRQLPFLPSLLPDLFEEVNLPEEERFHLTKAVINYCHALFDALEQREPAIMVELRLEWAKILQNLPYRYSFPEQVEKIMETWLKQRNLVSYTQKLGFSSADFLTEISKNLLPEDTDFVNFLNELLQELGETNFLNIALSCFQRGSEHLQAKRYDLAKIDFDRTIYLNPHADAYYERAIATYHLQDYHNTIADLDKAIALQPQRAELHDFRGNTYLKLNNYELALANYNQAVTLGFPNQKLTNLQRKWNNKFRQEEENRKRRETEEARKRAETEAEIARKKVEEEQRKGVFGAKFSQNFTYTIVKVNKVGNIINKTEKKGEQLVLDIKGVPLELVYIKGGEFVMGSPEGEGDSNEKPQRRVKVRDFYMGKYPVTQKQYQVIMGNNPSNFKGEENPVERVSWNMAKEFVEKIQKYFTEKYGNVILVSLPSEAQWEYACKAGTTTPFAFGKTLSTEISNYNGNYPYGQGVKGEYRQKTVKVGSFYANDWGLYDLHGNVWECCQDDWHDSYEDAPDDDTSWLSSNVTNNLKLLRGGSWNNDADNCRSAKRSRNSAVNVNSNSGFRLACFLL